MRFGIATYSEPNRITVYMEDCQSLTDITLATTYKVVELADEAVTPVEFGYGPSVTFGVDTGTQLYEIEILRGARILNIPIGALFGNILCVEDGEWEIVYKR